MNAKKETQVIQGTKQEFLKIFREMCYSRSAWQGMFFSQTKEKDRNYGLCRCSGLEHGHGGECSAQSDQ